MRKTCHYLKRKWEILHFRMNGCSPNKPSGLRRLLGQFQLRHQMELISIVKDSGKSCISEKNNNLCFIFLTQDCLIIALQFNISAFLKEILWIGASLFTIKCSMNSNLYEGVLVKIWCHQLEDLNWSGCE